MVTIGFGRDDPRQWVKAAYLILDGMESGSRGPRDPVPSAAELADRLGVSLSTPKRAFRELTEMGILYRVPGHGYFPNIMGPTVGESPVGDQGDDHRADHSRRGQRGEQAEQLAAAEGVVPAVRDHGAAHRETEHERRDVNTVHGGRRTQTAGALRRVEGSRGFSVVDGFGAAEFRGPAPGVE